jgi:hypothetical protein
MAYSLHIKFHQESKDEDLRELERELVAAGLMRANGEKLFCTITQQELSRALILSGPTGSVKVDEICGACREVLWQEQAADTGTVWYFCVASALEGWEKEKDKMAPKDKREDGEMKPRYQGYSGHGRMPGYESVIPGSSSLVERSADDIVLDSEILASIAARGEDDGPPLSHYEVISP